MGAEMEQAHRIGTVVALRDRRLAEQIRRGEELGVVVQRRRSDARVLFLSDRQTHWIDDARLWPVQSEQPALARVSALLRILEPEEAQVERADEEVVEVHALCTAFDDSTMRSLREALGDALLRWAVQPYGMAYFSVVLELRAG